MSDNEKEYRKSEKKSSKKRSTPASAPMSESATLEQPPVPEILAADHANDGFETVDLEDDDSTPLTTTTTSVAAKTNTAVATEQSVPAATSLVNTVGGGDTAATQHTQPHDIVPRDAKRVKTDATLAVVVVKPREHGLLDISRTVCASEQAVACKVEMKSRAHSHLLVLITNDVGWKPKNNADRDNTSTSTIMNYVVLRVLDSVGFNSAPYENFEGANPKHLVYREKKSGKEIVKPTKMASLEKIGNINRLDCKSWESHPTAMMKTKWRGMATGIVGNVFSGLPMVGHIFHDQKELTMGPDVDIFDKMGAFTIAIVGLAARSLEQCKAGYGLKVASVKVLEDVNIASIGSLLPEPALFYDDKSDIGRQTEERMAIKTNTEVFDADVSFISNLVRPNKEKASEKPLVRVDLKCNLASKHKHKVHIQSNNKVLELEFFNEDGVNSSIYHGKRFRISIPHNMFTIQETGLPWIQMYFQWLLDSNACEILIIHDQWQMDKMNEGGAAAGMHCCIVPKETHLTSPSSSELVLTDKLQSALKTPSAGNHLPLDITASIDNYTAWIVQANDRTKKTYAVILDVSKIYTIKPVEMDVDADANDEVLSDVGVDAVESDADAAASKPLVKSNKSKQHTSFICRVYPGMDVERTVSSAFLLILDDVTGKVDSLLPVGIKSKPTYKYANSAAMAAAGNILSNPKNLLQ